MGETGAIDRSDPNTAKWVVGILNRQYLASFLGAKYFLFKGRPFGGDQFNFPQVQQVEDVFINRSELALPLVIAYDSYLTEADYRTLGNGSKDHTMFRAMVVGEDDLDKVKGLRRMSPADTVANLMVQDFSTAAQERRDMLSADMRKVKDGIAGTIELKKDGVVVVQLPYDERFKLLVNGVEQESFVGNFGFISFPLSAGKHELEVRMDF
jgi:uncharacterized membrane protein YfhO